MQHVNYARHATISVLLVVLFSLFANGLFAQIQTKILGCRVGSSTANEVMTILNQQGYKVYVVEYNQFSRDHFKSGDYSFQIYGSILFGGVRCDHVSFTFIGQKLYSVSFDCRNFNKNAYDKLLSDLQNKYSNYYKPEESDIFKLFKAKNDGVYSGGASDL